MCLQCLTNPFYYGEVLPTWYLIRARRHAEEMRPKDWGLLQCNDPSIIFSTTPYIYKSEDLLDEAINAFSAELICSPAIGYALCVAYEKFPKPFALRRLFAKYHAYSFTSQLYIVLAEHIRNTTPFTEPDEFPNNDQFWVTDYVFDPKLP